MKRSYLLLVPMVLAMLTIIVEKPAQAQSTPTQITTCQELQNINNNLSGNYQLANDIDCSATTTWNNGFGFIPIDSYAGNASAPVFTGVLDGQGHTINNLYINASNVGIGTTGPVSVGTTSPLGVFSVASGAVIEDVNVANATIKGGQYNIIAILAGYMQSNSVVHNVSVQGSVVAGTYAYTGGLVGSLESSQISESSADISITGGDYTVGGLVGYFSSGVINESYAVGSINSQAITGGLVGTSEYQSSINNSYSNVEINYTCLPQGSYYSGGIGGLVGSSYDSSSPYLTIDDSYAAGKITTQGSNCANYETGGLVASTYNIPTVTSSYWDSQATGQYTSVGSSSSAGLTTSEMELQSSFVGWNFTNIWISDNQHYPIFIWQQEPHIKLWNIFSAASQGSTLEPPPGTVNWTNLSNINAIGINWTDLLVLSKPFVWNYQSATTVGGFPNSINWTDLGAFASSTINWGDVDILARLGINWASANPLVKSGINWTDWFVATVSGVNWNDVYVASRVGINWTSIGTLGGSINWSNLAGLTRQGVNWGQFSNLSQNNVNWNNTEILNALKINTIDLNTIRKMGVNPNGAFPSLPSRAQLTLILNGSASGTFTSTPAGIYCTSGSSAGCTASFPLNHQVTLNFFPINNSYVSNWGGCNSSMASSCSLTPDGSVFLNIAVSPGFTISTSTNGTGTGQILCNGGACPASVPAGSQMTFTAQPNPGSVFSGWEGTYCTAPGGSNENPCTILNIDSNISVEAYFTPSSYALNLTTYGSGSATFLCNGSTCPASVAPGTSMTFTVHPNPGTVFETWANTCTSAGGTANGASCTINNISSNVTLEAILGLAPPSYTITTSTSGPGKGSVLCNGSTCPASVTSGTVITFTGQPAKGSILEGLGGVCAAPGGPIFTCPFEVTSNIDVSAYFIKSPPPAPTKLTAASSTSGINLSWSNQYPVSFNLYRAEIGVNGNKYTLIKNVGYPSTSYSDTSMPKYGTYDYYVTGVYYPNIESPRSNVASVDWRNPALKAAMKIPAPNSTFSGTKVTFTWSGVAGAREYALWVGTQAGTSDIYEGTTTGGQLTVSNINVPNTGKVYVRLLTSFDGTWNLNDGNVFYNDYVYTGGAPKTNAPIGTIAIDGGVSQISIINPTAPTAVTLTLDAVDAPNGGGVTTMEISNSVNFSSNETKTYTYATKKAWDLLAGTGIRTVYVKYQNKSGYWSPVYKASVSVYLIDAGVGEGF